MYSGGPRSVRVSERNQGRESNSSRYGLRSNAERALSLDLKKQSDKFALAVGVRLGEYRFQLITSRLLGDFKLLRGNVGRGAASYYASKPCL